MGYGSDLYNDEESFYTDSPTSDRDSPEPERRRRRSRHRDRSHYDRSSYPEISVRRNTNRYPPDPKLYDYSRTLQTEQRSQSPFRSVNVTIKRNDIEPNPTLAQPLMYPMSMYVEQPAIPYPNYHPMQPIQMIMNPPAHIMAQQPPIMIQQPPVIIQQAPVIPQQPPVIAQTPVQTLAPALRVQASIPSPRVAQDKPLRKAPVSPLSNFSDRYETESFTLPSRRDKANRVRSRPAVHMDDPSMPPIGTSLPKSRNRPIIVDDYTVDKKAKTPPAKPAIPPPPPPPLQTISYRAVKEGLTTRELENKHASKKGNLEPERDTPNQKVTYRDRVRRH